MAVLDRSMMVEPELPGSTPVEEGKDREGAAPEWSPGKRIFFRFGFSYLVLYLLSAFLGLVSFIPYSGVVVQ